MKELYLPESFGELRHILQRHSDELILLNLTHGFCSDCLLMRPKFRKLAASHNAICVEVELGEMNEALKFFKVEKMPTFLAMHRDKEMARCAGFRNSLDDFANLALEKMETEPNVMTVGESQGIETLVLRQITG